MIKITIDGGAGVGKSTLAAILAKKNNFEYVNTGYIYRGLAVLMSEGIDVVLEDWVYDYEYYERGAESMVRFGETFIMESTLKKLDVGEKASQISKRKEIRDIVNIIIKNYKTSKKGIILEGRDMGSVVVPEANLKLFLEADLKVRAERRLKDFPGSSIDEIVKNIQDRDKRDSSRSIAPLVKAKDAITVNTGMVEVELLSEIISQLISKLC